MVSVADSKNLLQKRVLRVLELLKENYPQAQCSLVHRDPFQLLVATVLSAQCTDKRVNLVTPALFKRYPTAFELAEAKRSDVEKLIRSTGFYKNKAESLLKLSKDLVAEYGGKVPSSMEALIRLRGVGRKTANVVLGNAFQIHEGVVVDTHVGRLSRRLGFTREQNPEKVERNLVQLIPKRDWTIFSHLLIEHGRAVCFARNPQCASCFLGSLCPKVGVKPKK